MESIRVKQVCIADSYRVASVAEGRSSEQKTTLYPANPGRVQAINDIPRFSAVVIDATHPRTGSHLSHLLACPPIDKSRLIVVLSPPVEDDLLVGDRLTWIWDPRAIAQLNQAVSNKPETPDVAIAPRHDWIAADLQVEEQLQRAHALLAGAMRLIRS